MKAKNIPIWVMAILMVNHSPELYSQGTAFNYQGALTENGAPGNGAYDFQFRLFDSANGGNAVGSELGRAPLQVIEGNFNVLLDFGPEAFDGRPRWLELAVRSNGVAQARTVLTPRQQILPVPYAIFAVTASNVLNNAITGMAIQNATLTADKFSEGQVVKSLNSLHDHVVLQAGANVTIATNDHALIIGALSGGGGGDDWHVTGNAGTAPPVDFLGTTDDQPFEIKVNNLRGLRVQPDAASFICDIVANVVGIGKSPSLIGGYAGNIIPAGIAGSVISGGGAFNHPCLGGELANIITADFANINGGLGNRADGTISTIGGGARNRTGSGANYAVIGGGGDNVIEQSTDANTISGGAANVLETQTDGSTIGGGTNNRIQQFSDFSTIAGGLDNLVRSNANSVVIAGGLGHSVGTNSNYSVIGGGERNSITASVQNSGIGGGVGNTIESYSDTAFLGGGNRNLISSNAPRSILVGGEGNTIAAGALHSVIGGGSFHVIRNGARFGVIVGGDHNEVGPRADFAAIVGGEANKALESAQYATIGGGGGNVAGTNASYTVIGGGQRNTIENSAYLSTIGGGTLNRIGELAYESTIGGGDKNVIGASAQFATTAGGTANIIGARAQSAAIGGGAENRIGDDGAGATIAGGFRNLVARIAPWSTISGGRNNMVTNTPDATISGGNGNQIDPGSAAATIGGGQANRASAIAATVPGGMEAHARSYGQQALAAGRFAQNGDAQTSVFVLRGTTSDATPRELFLDGTNRRMGVPSGGAWTFDILVVGREQGGASAGYKICGVIENNDSGERRCNLVGLPEVTVVGEQRAAWNVSVEADDGNDALVIKVVGETARSIRWVASVRTAEVIY